MLLADFSKLLCRYKLLKNITFTFDNFHDMFRYLTTLTNRNREKVKESTLREKTGLTSTKKVFCRHFATGFKERLKRVLLAGKQAYL